MGSMYQQRQRAVSASSISSVSSETISASATAAKQLNQPASIIGGFLRMKQALKQWLKPQMKEAS